MVHKPARSHSAGEIDLENATVAQTYTGKMTSDQEGDRELAADRAIALRLSRTWDPFFGRFGRLREVQRIAIPAILAGRDVLISAPTASGKTEAACAPLVERRIGRAHPSTILYISPTRALVNDLYGRLLGPLEQLQQRVVRRTGDHRDALSRTPNVLITTPESFDSLLCRGRTESGHVLAHVGAVVLDEIHLLHGTARGEQVRWLLERLRRLRSFAVGQAWTSTSDVQIIGLSATVPSPQQVVDAYLPGGELISVKGARDIESVITGSASAAIESALPSYLGALDHPEKILVFANKRLRVDLLATELRPKLEMLGYAVHGHHGSLAKREREAAEEAARTEKKIVLFATSTLEIGIDIGDIDLVVLDEPAPDVSALLQRIGRGNRRTGKTRVMLCSRSKADVIIHAAMLQAARDGYFGAGETGPNYSVARQQLASYIFQSSTRAREKKSLESLLLSCVAPISDDGLIDHLLQTGELHSDKNGVRLGGEWLESSARGEIHSNIENQGGHTVIDHRTGDHIALGVKYGGSSRLAIAGHVLDVRAFNSRTVEVQRNAHGGMPPEEWAYTSKKWITGPGQPQTVRRFLGLGSDEWPVLRLDDGVIAVFHFGGARRAALLRLMCGIESPVQEIEVDSWTIRLSGRNGHKPAWLTDSSAALLDLLIAENLDTLEKTLGRPSANAKLPLPTRVAEVRGWLDIEVQLERLRASRWTTAIDGPTRDALILIGRKIWDG